MSTKISKDHAEEWRNVLRLHGEGTYRNIVLAIDAGVPKALGFIGPTARRDFVRSLGQQMLVDTRPAIIDLAGELRHPETTVKGEPHHLAGQPKIKAIADVLSISPARVEWVLAEEGMIELTPAREKMLKEGILPGGHHWIKRDAAEQKELSAGTSDEKTDLPAGSSAEKTDLPAGSSAEVLDAEIVDVEAMEKEIELLRDELKVTQVNAEGSKKKATDEKAKLRAKIKELTDALKELQDEPVAELTEQEKALAKKEAEAWAQGIGSELLAGLAPIHVKAVEGELFTAREGLSKLISSGVLTEGLLKGIGEEIDALIEEYNVALMSVTKQA